MGPGISHRQKVMCPLLNGQEIFAIIYGRAYSSYWQGFALYPECPNMEPLQIILTDNRSGCGLPIKLSGDRVNENPDPPDTMIDRMALHGQRIR